MARTVAITGANGYLGRRLAVKLAALGYEVRALVRDARGLPAGITSFTYELGTVPPAEALAGVSALIHCAHDFSGKNLEDSLRLNAEGSAKLFEAARAAGAQQLVFISSMAAFEGCRSVYGRTKLAAEKEAIKSAAWVIRPGTIYTQNPAAGEKEGLFGALRKLGTKLPLVPLIGGGKQKLYLVSIEDLCEVIVNILGRPASKVPGEPVALASIEPLSLKEIIAKLAAEAGRKPLFLPLPAWCFLVPMRAAETIGLKLPFRSDSLISLVNLNPAPGVVSEFHGVKLRSL